MNCACVWVDQLSVMTNTFDVLLPRSAAMPATSNVSVFLRLLLTAVAALDVENIMVFFHNYVSYQRILHFCV